MQARPAPSPHENSLGRPFRRNPGESEKSFPMRPHFISSQYFQRAGKRLKPWWVSSAKIRCSCNLQRSFAKEGSYASPLARRHSVHACSFGSGRQRLCCLWGGFAHLRSPSAPHFYAGIEEQQKSCRSLAGLLNMKNPIRTKHTGSLQGERRGVGQHKRREEQRTNFSVEKVLTSVK